MVYISSILHEKVILCLATHALTLMMFCTMRIVFASDVVVARVVASILQYHYARARRWYECYHNNNIGTVYKLRTLFY